MAKKRITAKQVRSRIDDIRYLLDTLKDDISAAVGDEYPQPDTERLFDCQYMVGPPVGLGVAASALEGIDDDTISNALDTPIVQRKRAEAVEMSMTPKLRKFIKQLKGGRK